MLTALARTLVKAKSTDALHAAPSREEVVRLISDVIGDTPAPATPAASATSTGSAASDAAPAAGASGGRRRMVAVTAYPTGIAHTYIAAEALEAAAAARTEVDLASPASPWSPRASSARSTRERR